jgi:hypothetical protein
MKLRKVCSLSNIHCLYGGKNLKNRATEKNTNHFQHDKYMSTTSKSRLVLFLMIVIALVFFIASFLAAAFSNGVNTTTTTAGSSSQSSADVSCIAARTAERVFGECSYS